MEGILSRGAPQLMIGDHGAALDPEGLRALAFEVHSIGTRSLLGASCEGALGCPPADRQWEAGPSAYDLVVLDQVGWKVADVRESRHI